MSAFDDFVQKELPLRPFVSTDPDLETIPVRRGQGPRQLTFVSIDEGQILRKVNGELKGTDPSSMGQFLRTHIHTQITPALVWTISHNKNSMNCIVQIRTADPQPVVIYPDKIMFDDSNTVTIHWTASQDGTALLTFLD